MLYAASLTPESKIGGGLACGKAISCSASASNLANSASNAASVKTFKHVRSSPRKCQSPRCKKVCHTENQRIPKQDFAECVAANSGFVGRWIREVLSRCAIRLQVPTQFLETFNSAFGEINHFWFSFFANWWTVVAF